ncbi:hypothetical protein [Streptomyces katsurahamanus]|uniref:Integral membrane protein n=1 Tax=Streptomyces katsurahamanus TaxID=2577098 RepID=A0ABW9NWD4_9ACTN|nr:hypothetical protein [Streptomyces katsurahamanus]MQS37587.1 hypothetical protein [Streptomyces katsurahamanus]
MLALRLARGTHPLVLLRRLLVAAASGGVGFLLLCALAYALTHPGDRTAALLRLSWCAIPLAATVHFAVAVAHTDPSTRPRTGLSAVGLGPGRLAALAAASTALSGALGSVLALLFFLHLRGDLTGLPFDGAARELLAAEAPLPLAATLTLLALVPLTATVAAALALRGRDAARDRAPVRPPGGLPWGCALTTAGLAVGTFTARAEKAAPLPLPKEFGAHPAGVLAGWALTAVGLAFAGPALTFFCGRLLQILRPGAVRLLAGRILMEESHRIGRPLGVVCAVASAVITAWALYDTGPRPFGPLTGLGAALVVACTTATLLTAVAQARHDRATATEELRRLGTPVGTLRLAALLRAAVLLLVFAPLTWAVATLAALPLSR